MKEIHYIIVNESNSERAARAFLRDRNNGYANSILVRGKGLFRRELLDQLVSIRRIYPDAKILGLSELDGHNIRPSEAMNALRRAMSEAEGCFDWENDI